MSGILRYCDVCAIESCEATCFNCGAPTIDWAAHKALIASRFEAPNVIPCLMVIKFEPEPEPLTDFDPEVAQVAW